MTGCSVTHNMDETPDEFIGGIKDINRTRKLIAFDNLRLTIVSFFIE